MSLDNIIGFTKCHSLKNKTWAYLIIRHPYQKIQLNFDFLSTCQNWQAALLNFDLLKAHQISKDHCLKCHDS